MHRRKTIGRKAAFSSAHHQIWLGDAPISSIAKNICAILNLYSVRLSPTRFHKNTAASLLHSFFGQLMKAASWRKDCFLVRKYTPHTRSRLRYATSWLRKSKFTMRRNLTVWEQRLRIHYSCVREITISKCCPYSSLM